MDSKLAILPLLILLLFTGVANSTKNDLSPWEEVVDRVTLLLREIGYPRAGTPCAKLGKSLDRCVAVDEDGNVEEVPFLECDQLVGVLGVGLGECKVKGWAVFLLIAVIIVIPISLIMGLACCCMRC